MRAPQEGPSPVMGRIAACVRAIILSCSIVKSKTGWKDDEHTFFISVQANCTFMFSFALFLSNYNHPHR